MQSFYKKFRGDDYLEQWERVKRWYGKVQGVKNNTYQKSNITIEEQEDYLYIYFLQICNLKDWIKNSKKNSNIEKLFNGTTGIKSLQIVVDFVNNAKHFDNSKNTRNYEDTYLVSRNAQSGGNGSVHTWWIQTGISSRIGAYKLAEESFLEVEKFLIKENLI